MYRELLPAQEVLNRHKARWNIQCNLLLMKGSRKEPTPEKKTIVMET